MVSVPVELLRKVLEQAESDNASVEAERYCIPQDRYDEHRQERAAIDELRRIAGITE